MSLINLPLIHRQALAEKYYNLATCVLIVYDHALTFDVEVERIWSQRWTFPKFLWFLFRYLTPIIQIGSVVEDISDAWTIDGCRRWIWFRTIGDEIVTYATFAVMILRIWALYKKARWVIIIMLCAMLAQLGITIWAVQAISSTTQSQLTGFGCAPFAKNANQLALGYVGVFIMDAVILLFSCLRIFKFYAKRRSTSELFSLMIRDGVVYFFIICIVNFANVLLIKLPTATTLKPLNSEFTVNISVLLVSRLVLNLRATEPTLTPNEPAESTLVGNLGAPVVYSTPAIKIRVTTERITYSDRVPDDRLELRHLRRPSEGKVCLSV